MLKLSSSTASFAFDPTLARGYQQFMLLGLFCDTLVRLGESGAIEAGIAESWKFSQGPGSHRFTFKLNSQARFHDGRKINARDVAWSLSRHFFSNSSSIVKTYLGGALKNTAISPSKLLEAIQVEGDDTLSVELKGPYQPFLSILASPAFCVLPQDFDINKPVGSGPYLVETASKDGKTLLTSAPGFIGNPPFFGRISVTILKFKDEILNAFKKGDIDFALGIPFSEFREGDLPADGAFQHGNSLSITSIFLNLNRTMFKSRDFRKDLAALFNLVKNSPGAMSSFDRLQTSFLPIGIMPQSYYERSAINMSPAAFKKKWVGQIPAELDIVIAMGFCTPEYKTALASVFEQAGLSYRIRELKGEPLLQAMFKGDYDLAFVPYAGLLPDPDGFLDLLSPEGIMKAGQIPSAKVIQALEKVRFESDTQLRLKGYEGVLKPFEEDYYLIPIAQQNLPVLYRKGLHVPDSKFRFHLDLRGIRLESGKPNG
ncbi:ABC transporter substrate-binding protein [Bdellovibrionota bacterium FG-2]